jgi:RES domain-containing protein
MNAQGVPMLYVTLDAETACAEVASHSPYDETVVGAFILQQPLRILDLTQVPPPRSVFDETHKEGDDRLSSLSFYKDRITRPVILDDNHPVDYVPSQMLTEAFRWWTNPRLDGIAYPSRVRKGGTNVVLFFGDPK